MAYLCRVSSLEISTSSSYRSIPGTPKPTKMKTGPNKLKLLHFNIANGIQLSIDIGSVLLLKWKKIVQDKIHH